MELFSAFTLVIFETIFSFEFEAKLQRIFYACARVMAHNGQNVIRNTVLQVRLAVLLRFIHNFVLHCVAPHLSLFTISTLKYLNC